MVNHFKSDLTQLPLVFKGEFIEKHTRLSKNYVVTELGTCKVTMDQQEKQCLCVDLSNGSKPKWSGGKREERKVNYLKFLRLLQSKIPQRYLFVEIPDNLIYL